MHVVRYVGKHGWSGVDGPIPASELGFNAVSDAGRIRAKCLLTYADERLYGGKKKGKDTGGEWIYPLFCRQMSRRRLSGKLC